MSREYAKDLRGRMTDAERRLWYRLRAHRLNGHKFKRQVPVGPYVVDFASLDRKLIIEVDGGQHAESSADRRPMPSCAGRVIASYASGIMMC